MTEPTRKRPIGARWLNGKTAEELAAENAAHQPPPPQWAGNQPPQQAPPPYYGQPWQPPPDPNRNKGKAIAALTLGICSAVFAFILNIFAFPALAAGIVGLILAYVAKDDQKMARAAVWINGAGIGVSVYAIYQVLHAINQINGN